MDERKGVESPFGVIRVLTHTFRRLYISNIWYPFLQRCKHQSHHPNDFTKSPITRSKKKKQVIHISRSKNMIYSPLHIEKDSKVLYKHGDSGYSPFEKSK